MPTDERYPKTDAVYQEDQMFPNAKVFSSVSDDVFSGYKEGTEVDPDSYLEPSKLWMSCRLQDRYYPVFPRTQSDYQEKRLTSSDQIARIGESLRHIQEKLRHENVTAENECLDLLEGEVWNLYSKSMFFLMFEDGGFDLRTTGRLTCVMNEAVIPVLTELESHVTTEAEAAQVSERLIRFVETVFTTDMSVFDPLRYEIARTVLNISGSKGSPYLERLFQDLDNKIEEQYRQSQQIYKEEVGIPVEDDAVWAFNIETGELGFFGKSQLSSIIIPQEPVTEEEMYAPSELDLGGGEHVILHREILQLLEKYALDHPEERDATMSMICQFMGHWSAGALSTYTEVFSKLGIENSYPRLLEKLNDPSILVKRMSAEILYRLELGKIGVTDKDGVKYFDKVYRLVVDNDPDFFVRLYRQGNAYVRRLDTQGSIGVFNGPDDRLLGRFQLQLEAEGSYVRAPVDEIVSRDVFLPKADETPTERQARENMLQLYLAGYGKLFDQINDRTGVKLSSLELHEQGWFISYYSTATPEQQLELTQFVKTYGELGLKVFLALDYGGSGGEIIKYNTESAASEEQKRALFMDFHRISLRAFEWRKVFEQAEANTSLKFSAQVHEALIRKGSEYFIAALMIEQGRGGEVTREELTNSMGQIAYALDALKGLYDKPSSLMLERPKGKKGSNPQICAEPIDQEGKIIIEDALTSWTLVEPGSGTRVIVSVRPYPTQGGEARMNFRVSNPSRGVEARIGVDLSNYGIVTGMPDKQPVVSLDIGTGKVDKEHRLFPSQRVGNILSMVEGSEGGHNERSFSLETAEHFEDLANSFTAYMMDRYTTSIV